MDKTAYPVTYQGAGESLRTDDRHLNLWSDGKEGMELYDTRRDPGEFTNLAKVSEYAEPLAYLMAQLRVKRATFKRE